MKNEKEGNYENPQDFDCMVSIKDFPKILNTFNSLMSEEKSKKLLGSLVDRVNLVDDFHMLDTSGNLAGAFTFKNTTQGHRFFFELSRKQAKQTKQAIKYTKADLGLS